MRFLRRATLVQASESQSAIVWVLLLACTIGLVKLDSSSDAAAPGAATRIVRNEIKVQLKPRASLDDEHVNQLLECVARSSYLLANRTNNGQFRFDTQRDDSFGRPEEAASSIENKPSSCSVELVGKFNSPFLGHIRLGEPEQEFEVLLDTGSDMIWVPHEQSLWNGKRLDSRARNLFVTRSQSHGFKQATNYTISVTYANGFHVRGRLVSDVLRLGREPSLSLTVSEQKFMLVDQIETGGSLPFFDGIVGLRENGGGRQANLLSSLVQQKLIRDPVFTVYTRTPSSGGGSPAHDLALTSGGELAFGGIDHSQYKGQIAWAPVLWYPRWSIRIERIEVLEGANNNSVLATACQDGCEALVDTGSYYVFGPKEQVVSLNRKLGFEPWLDASVFWSRDFLETSKSKQISLVFHINGERLVFDERAYGMMIGGQAKATSVPNREHSKQLCLSIVSSFDLPDGKPLPHWILGAKFIEKFYTIFDFGQQRIGFAMKAEID